MYCGFPLVLARVLPEISVAMAPPDLGDLSADRRIGFQMQAALQNIRWTYSILWKFSPEKLLVWSNGLYNGDMEYGESEICGERSVQLRELFRSLSSSADGVRGRGSERENGTRHLPRTTTPTLAPEDLTNAEWFYLLSMSYQFKPSLGLPGLALETRSPVWLNNASEADSKIFKRNLLAKSSGIKTVIFFPLRNGVVEFGVTEQVQEDPDLIEHISSFFVDF